MACNIGTVSSSALLYRPPHELNNTAIMPRDNKYFIFILLAFFFGFCCRCLVCLLWLALKVPVLFIIKGWAACFFFELHRSVILVKRRGGIQPTVRYGNIV